MRGRKRQAQKETPPHPEGLRGRLGDRLGGEQREHNRIWPAQLLSERKNAAPIRSGAPIRADKLPEAYGDPPNCQAATCLPQSVAQPAKKAGRKERARDLPSIWRDPKVSAIGLL